ncbi:hypothetical protein ABMV16_02060 [Corynebacterium belfantii]|nr:hypothetical protein [Corynebacterium belfantii]
MGRPDTCEQRVIPAFFDKAPDGPCTQDNEPLLSGWLRRDIHLLGGAGRSGGGHVDAGQGPIRFKLADVLGVVPVQDPVLVPAPSTLLCGTRVYDAAKVIEVVQVGIDTCKPSSSQRVGVCAVPRFADSEDTRRRDEDVVGHLAEFLRLDDSLDGGYNTPTGGVGRRRSLSVRCADNDVPVRIRADPMVERHVWSQRSHESHGVTADLDRTDTPFLSLAEPRTQKVGSGCRIGLPQRGCHEALGVCEERPELDLERFRNVSVAVERIRAGRGVGIPEESRHELPAAPG